MKILVLIFSVGVFITLSFLGYQEIEHKSQMNYNPQIYLKALIDSDKINISFINDSSKKINLWSFDDVHGWETLSFRLNTKSSQYNRIIKRRVRDWTRGEKNVIEIASQTAHLLDVNLKDGWWEIDENINELKSESIQFQAVFVSSSTPEAKEHDVYVGELVSDWIVSEPPHSWLFSDHLLEIRLNIESDVLVLSISNISSDNIRIWEFDNSWGWEALSFKLKTQEKKLKISRKIRHFNEKPAYFNLVSKETKVFKFDIKDKWWDLHELPQYLVNIPFQVQAQMHVPVYLETEEYGVFYGMIQSEWIISKPPHTWLFKDE